MRRPKPGAVPQDHARVCVVVSSSEPFPDAGWMISETSRLDLQLRFPDQRHSRKMAFTCLIIMFNGCFVSFFGLSGFVHVRGGGGPGV